MKKLYAIEYRVGRYSTLGPAPFSNYPHGVEIVEPPTLACNETGATLHITVRCEDEVGKSMGWIPFEKPTDG